jgi:hypothetical protein
MRGLIRELLTAFLVLTALYLVLIHFTGFARDVGALGSATQSIWKTAQGR